MFEWLKSIISSELGQLETPPAPEGDGLDRAAFDVPDDGDEAVEAKEEATEETTEEAAPEHDIPEELKPAEGLDPKLEKHRAGMHKALTKKYEKIAAREAELDDFEEREKVVTKFHNDKQYAADTVQKWAKDNGYQITRAGAVVPATGADPGAPPSLPPQYVEAVRSQLAPELQAFAPSIAGAAYALNKAMLAPLQKQQQEAKDATDAKAQDERMSQVSSLMEELEDKAPGWQEHEDDMMSLMDYLESSDLIHKRWGSKALLLLNIASGNAQATNAAAERMRSAARHKGVKPQGSKGPNSVVERIVKAQTDDEAWAIAREDALSHYSGPTPE